MERKRSYRDETVVEKVEICGEINGHGRSGIGVATRSTQHAPKESERDR